MTRKHNNMKQLTIRNNDPELERALRGLAAREGISLNQAAVRLLRRGAGLRSEATPADVVGDSLDRLAGTWSDEEKDEFLAAVEPCEMIDESLWR